MFRIRYINRVHDMNGVLYDKTEDVSAAFLSFSTTLLGTIKPNRSSVIKEIVQQGLL